MAESRYPHDVLNVVLPKGSLEKATLELFAAADLPVNRSSTVDYKATDFDLAFAQWMHGINRGILLPPGLDEQWLISVMHSEADAMRYADVFAEFVAELTA